MQMSVAGGLHHCTIFIARTPSLVRRWLKELGNSENSSATGTTALEKMRSTDVVEKSFDAKKKENGWTIDSLGQTTYEAKKRELMQQIYPDRWSTSSSSSSSSNKGMRLDLGNRWRTLLDAEARAASGRSRCRIRKSALGHSS